MSYEREEAMRQQEATEAMIRMREPRRSGPHPDPLADDRELSLLRIIAALAEELVSPVGMVNRGVDRGLVVVEKADKSDPHYRLCTALETLRAVQGERT